MPNAATSADSTRNNPLADFPALFRGTASNSTPATPPLPEGFTLDAAPSRSTTQLKNAPKPGADFDVTTLPGLPDGFTLDSDPSISNPQGIALGRALKRGMLRTRSTLPAIQAQKGATVLADAALPESDLIRNVFLETTRLPDVPEGVDISTPELASAAIAQMGYPAQFANTFRQTYDIRARDAAAAVGNEGEVLQTAVGNIQEAQGLNDRAAALPGGPNAEAFKQVLSEAPDTLLDVLKVYAQNPGTALAFLGETAAESLPQMGASAATTLATRSPAAGALVLGGGTVAQEFGSSVNEFFAEQGVSPKTPEEAEALIRDPAFMAEASRRGLGRGVVIALAEMAGQGVAAQQLFKGAVKEAGKDVTAQMATGAGGEAAARAATGQEMSAREIVTEALAEGIAAPVEVGATVYQSRKNAKADQQPPETPEDSRTPAEALAVGIDAAVDRTEAGPDAAEPVTDPYQPKSTTRDRSTYQHSTTISDQNAQTTAPRRLGHEGRLSLQKQMNAVSDPTERAAAQQQWVEDVQSEINERASHPQLEERERRVSTARLQEIMDSLRVAATARAPDPMLVQDRMNLLEMHLTSDRVASSSHAQEQHTLRLAFLAATRRVFEHRLTNPAFGAPDLRVAILRDLQVIKALEFAQKDRRSRENLVKINTDLERKLAALDKEFGVKRNPQK